MRPLLVFGPLALFLSGVLALPLASKAQTLVITNGVQTYTSLASTTVTMSNRCELRITGTSTPLSGCIISLNSADTCFVMQNIAPSVVVSTYLSQVRVNGAAAVADSNCRVVRYGVGAIVIPQAPSFQPLQIFSMPHFMGVSSNLSQYIYYKGSALGLLNGAISSFKLKRGYMATLAQNENGAGYSKNYVAADGDMEVSVLPDSLDDNVRFVYVTAWRWTSKKGIGGDIESGLNLGWKYNWNINQSSTRDLQYIPIRQQRFWPGLSQNWQTMGAEHLLGYNEPDKSDQANIAVSDAISSWPDLLGTGLRVGAPAVSDGGRSGWLYPFISQADAAGLRVDFVPVHYYWCYSPSDPNGAANQMYGFLKATYDTVKRPLWVTEWNNGANWTGCGDPTSAQQQAAIAAMVALLDSTPFVERYAFYNWVEDVRRVKWDDGSLTSAGTTYRDEVSPIGYVQGLQDNGTRSFTQLRFDGSTRDSSGYGNNGISAGSPAYTNGVTGQALVFDGAYTAVTLPPNVAKNNAFTFAGWIYWNGGPNWQRIFDFGNSTTDYLFLTPSSSSGTLRFGIKNGGGTEIVETSALTANQWQHVAITLSGTTARLYVNGVQAAANTSMTISPANFSPRVNRLGMSQYVGDPMFSGLMDDVLITDYALSALQIARLQTNTPPQFTTNLFVRGTATEGQSYSNSIAGTATDPDAGDTLTYSKAVGPAWLSVAADGTLTGVPTSGDGGTNYITVRATDAAGQNGFALVAIYVITITGSGTWVSDASANWGDTPRWSGNVVATGAGQTADFSTINITGNRTVTLDSSRTIGTLKFSDTSGSQTWTITNNGVTSLKLETGSSSSPSIVVTNTVTIGAAVTGTNGFIKSGPGTLILSGNNPLSGTVYLDTSSNIRNDGIVRITGPQALANASTISIRNNNSGNSTFQLDGSAGSITIDALVSATCRNNSVVTIQNMAGTNIFNGDIQIHEGGNSYTVQSDSGLVVFTGSTMYVGGLMGTRTNYYTGAGSHLLVGPFLNSTNGSPCSLTKSGTGTLTLMAVNTYGNGTTLSGGKLIVDGSLPAGLFNISSGTTLGGSGVINCPVSLPSGATLTPGDSIGTLIVSNTVTLQAGSTTRIELNKATGTNDQLLVVGSLAYGGTLTVTNVDGALWAGDSFQIFAANSVSGNFSATNLPALPNGFLWQWAPATGTLSIISTIALDPVNVTAIPSGNTLALSWPSDHTGWHAETNAVDITDTNSWFTLPGSTTTNQVFLPINPAAGQVFFRLRFP